MFLLFILSHLEAARVRMSQEMLHRVVFYGSNLNRSKVCFRQDKKLARISVKFPLAAWAPFSF